ncbi:MAG TPA: hypothetical protein VGH91_10455 [Gammaproteobacteria bacterium]|jgi:hypothetical protein
MKRYLAGLSALGCIGLSACTPANIRTLKTPDPAHQATLIVYRNSAFYAAGLDAIVGVDGSDITELPTHSLAILNLEPGQHDLFVRSNQADTPFHLPVKLEEKQTVCLEAKPRSGNTVASLLMPLAPLATGVFELDSTECLTSDAAKAYKTAPVKYAQ